MQKLWGKLWFRMLAAVISTPVITTIVMIAVAAIYILIFSPASFSAEYILPSPSILLVLAITGYVMALVPLIVCEVVNRRHAEPLPPQVCGLYLAIQSATSLIGLIIGMKLQQARAAPDYWVLIVLGGAYVVGIIVAYVLVSPLIRRARKASAPAAIMADVF